MRLCTKCMIPETHETIIYDQEGVCNICHQQEVKQDNIDWDQRKKDLAELVDQYRGKYDYDCIVPFSGGKDSTYTLFYLMREMKVKPLVVSYDHHFYRPNMIANVDRTIRTLGCDFLKFRTNWSIVQRVMLESLMRKGDFCWHCHSGVFAYPMQVAVKFNVPLVIWGEPSSEYTSYYDYDQMEEVDEKRFNMFVNLGITADDMAGMIGCDVRELDSFKYPLLKELKAIKSRSVCLGSYIPWDPKENAQTIMKELGWTGDEVEGVPPGYEYEKIECMMQGVRDYIKYIKRGYSRVSHLTSLDIRNKRMTRKEAENLVSEFEGKRPPSLDLFLKMIELTEDEFMDVVLKHAVSPYRHDPQNTQSGPKMHDMNAWDWKDLKEVIRSGKNDSGR